MGIVQDFKEFAVKGNAIDMAVGIIIGAAFGKIVASLVGDIVMPPIGYVIGGVQFSDLKEVLKPAILGPDGKVLTPEVAIRYGAFINTIIEFFIVAVSVFVMVRVTSKLMAMRLPIAIPGLHAAAPAAPASPAAPAAAPTDKPGA